MELHSRAIPSVGGITAQSVLPQGKIPEEGRTVRKEKNRLWLRQNQEAKLKIVGGVIPQSNQQEADPTNSYATLPQPFQKLLATKY